jgi:hypothetical protein
MPDERPVNEYWRWTEATGWVLHVRPLSRVELDAIERSWGGR